MMQHLLMYGDSSVVIGTFSCNGESGVRFVWMLVVAKF